MNNLPTIAGVEITTDEQGRFNLNLLHKAHLALNPDLHRNSKQPSDWLKLGGTKELLAEISNSEDLAFNPIDSKAGRYGGTFVHELLAISYAGWISPSFQLKVNQVFLDYRSGKFPEQYKPKELSRMDILQMAMESEQEKLRLSAEVEKLEWQQEIDKPKIALAESVEAAPDAIKIGKAAKLLNIAPQSLFSLMRRREWITRSNEPYQRRIKQGVLEVKLGSWAHPEKGLQQSITTLVTGKGLTRLREMLSQEGLA